MQAAQRKSPPPPPAPRPCLVAQRLPLRRLCFRQRLADAPHPGLRLGTHRGRQLRAAARKIRQWKRGGQARGCCHTVLQ